MLAGFILSPLCMVAQEPAPPEKSARSWLSENAWYFGYPNGMLFHTAFHGGFTTRYLLLKTAVRSTELSDYLSLSQEQQALIRDLKPVLVRLTELPDGFDGNDEPDEQVWTPEYFAFLSASQLMKLDLLAFRFDGYSALTRKSLALHLNIDESSQMKIRGIVRDTRDRIVLPRFRWEFAAPLPSDIKFRDCHFAGSICTQVNLQILEALTDEECERVHEFASALPTLDVVGHIEDMAQYPDGVTHLLLFTAKPPAGTKQSDAPARK